MKICKYCPFFNYEKIETDFESNAFDFGRCEISGEFVNKFKKQCRLKFRINIKRINPTIQSTQ